MESDKHYPVTVLDPDLTQYRHDNNGDLKIRANKLEASLRKNWGNDHGNLFNDGKEDNPQTKQNRMDAIKRRMSSAHKF